MKEHFKTTKFFLFIKFIVNMITRKNHSQELYLNQSFIELFFLPQWLS